MTISVRPCEDGLLLKVRVAPRASRNEVVGIHGDALKIRLTAPAVEGAANRALIDFLSRLFDLPRGSISIAGGPAARDKLIKVRGLNEEALLRTLKEVGSKR